MSMPALGPGNGDVAYRMQGLRHTPVEIALDESVPAGTLLRLWLLAAVPAFVVWAVFSFLALLVFAASEPSVFDSGTPGDGLFSAGSMLAFLLFWTVLLAARVDEPIAEWKTLLEDRWQGADSAYAAIYGTLRRRGIPVAANAVRVRSDLLAPEVLNNRLEITDRAYRVNVTVFPYGSSLYLGWTTWRGGRGATLLGHFLKDLAGGMFGRCVPIGRMLRTERARALREAVHAAVREGAEAAAQGAVVPLAPAFGAEVPVCDLRTRATPPAYGPPSAYGPPQSGPMPSGYAPGTYPPDAFAPPATSPTPPPTAPASGTPAFSGSPGPGVPASVAPPAGSPESGTPDVSGSPTSGTPAFSAVSIGSPVSGVPASGSPDPDGPASGEVHTGSAAEQASPADKRGDSTPPV
ncbi:adhesin [Actinoplanes oblitus]|uniref:Adhesin n=1 Tax=Actinoplanes oblitus TaxID=3040509 RepID=A0ABY8W9M4_9ACTN|nr:adhesin [Actinoplanes oblitus]WIM94564.1 adhesin [Actinoplanes oblitus]